jgi:hypothetical protein
LRTRSIGVLLALAAVMCFPPCNVGAASPPTYGGWGTSAASWSGVDGYVRQSGTKPVSSLHAVWVSLVSPNGGWEQIGEYQGDWAGGNSENSVSMYIEDRDDSCLVSGGMDYHPIPQGAPAAADQAYYVNRSASTATTHTCMNGQTSLPSWPYDFRIGTYSSKPVATGHLSVAFSWASAMTEDQNAPYLNTDYVGCDPSLTCAVAGNGLHLFDGVTWRQWDTSIPVGEQNNSYAPYLHPYQLYWSFKTCPTRC